MQASQAGQVIGDVVNPPETGSVGDKTLNKV